jgi:hypothetical protein
MVIIIDMATKIFRIFISGKISPRHSNILIHNMLPDLGYNTAEETLVRNMHRGVDESYFDVEFHNIDENIDYNAKVNAIKQYISESSIQYQDITTEPPKVGGSDN